MLRDALRTGRERQSLFIHQYKDYLASMQQLPLIQPQVSAMSEFPRQQQPEHRHDHQSSAVAVSEAAAPPPRPQTSSWKEDSGPTSDDSVVVSKNGPPRWLQARHQTQQASDEETRRSGNAPPQRSQARQQQYQTPADGNDAHNNPRADSTIVAINSTNNLMSGRAPPTVTGQPRGNSGGQGYGGVGLSDPSGSDDLRQCVEVLDEFAQFTISAAMGSRQEGVSGFNDI